MRRGSFSWIHTSLETAGVWRFPAFLALLSFANASPCQLVTYTNKLRRLFGMSNLCFFHSERNHFYAENAVDFIFTGTRQVAEPSRAEYVFPTIGNFINEAYEVDLIVPLSSRVWSFQFLGWQFRVARAEETSRRNSNERRLDMSSGNAKRNAEQKN